MSLVDDLVLNAYHIDLIIVCTYDFNSTSSCYSYCAKHDLDIIDQVKHYLNTSRGFVQTNTYPIYTHSRSQMCERKKGKEKERKKTLMLPQHKIWCYCIFELVYV